MKNINPDNKKKTKKFTNTKNLTNELRLNIIKL